MNESEPFHCLFYLFILTISSVSQRRFSNTPLKYFPALTQLIQLIV